MAHFDAAASRLRWSNLRTDELDATLAARGKDLGPRKRKADFVIYLVEQESYTFWRECSAARLRRVMVEKDITILPTASQDEMAQILAQQDAAANAVRAWSSRAVRDLRGAFLRNNISYSMRWKKWELVNELIKLRIPTNSIPETTQRTADSSTSPQIPTAELPITPQLAQGARPRNNLTTSRSTHFTDRPSASQVLQQGAVFIPSHTSEQPIPVLQPITTSTHIPPPVQATSVSTGQLNAAFQQVNNSSVLTQTRRERIEALRQSWDTMDLDGLRASRDHMFQALTQRGHSVERGTILDFTATLLPELDERIRIGLESELSHLGSVRSRTTGGRHSHGPVARIFPVASHRDEDRVTNSRINENASSRVDTTAANARTNAPRYLSSQRSLQPLQLVTNMRSLVPESGMSTASRSSSTPSISVPITGTVNGQPSQATMSAAQPTLPSNLAPVNHSLGPGITRNSGTGPISTHQDLTTSVLPSPIDPAMMATATLVSPLTSPAYASVLNAALPASSISSPPLNVETNHPAVVSINNIQQLQSNGDWQTILDRSFGNNATTPAYHVQAYPPLNTQHNVMTNMGAVGRRDEADTAISLSENQVQGERASEPETNDIAEDEDATGNADEVNRANVADALVSPTEVVEPVAALTISSVEDAGSSGGAEADGAQLDNREIDVAETPPGNVSTAAEIQAGVEDPMEATVTQIRDHEDMIRLPALSAELPVSPIPMLCTPASTLTSSTAHLTLWSSSNHHACECHRYFTYPLELP